MSTLTRAASLETPVARAAHALVHTRDSWAPTVLRVALGAVMLPHGLQKTLGWFGGDGLQGTMGFLTGYIGLPSPLALLVIAIESVGALALILGVGGRLAAAGIAAVMVGAVATMHLEHGFFMNWGGQQAGEGFEFHILAVAMAVAVGIVGSGKASVDRWLDRRIAG